MRHGHGDDDSICYVEDKTHVCYECRKPVRTGHRLANRNHREREKVNNSEISMVLFLLIFAFEAISIIS